MVWPISCNIPLSRSLSVVGTWVVSMIISAPTMGCPSGGSGSVTAGEPPGAHPGVLQRVSVICGAPPDPTFKKPTKELLIDSFALVHDWKAWLIWLVWAAVAPVGIW